MESAPSTPNEGIDMTMRTPDSAAGDSFDLGSVEAAVAVAIRAPSIYNTQPWCGTSGRMGSTYERTAGGNSPWSIPTGTPC
jgi:hypothetical protein